MTKGIKWQQVLTLMSAVATTLQGYVKKSDIPTVTFEGTTLVFPATSTMKFEGTTLVLTE